MRIGVAGHNLFDIAYAWLLAKQRGVESTASSSRCCSAWRRARPKPSSKDVGALLLYTPVVHPAEFDVAIAYLIRRLEENASQDNFMSAVFELTENEPCSSARRSASSPRWPSSTTRSRPPTARRTAASRPAPAHDSFDNTPDTNRQR